LIERVFRKVELSLPADRSVNQELDIKGFQDTVVGDWGIEANQAQLLSSIPVQIFDENDSENEYILHNE